MALALVWCTSCRVGELRTAQDELDAAMARWESHGIEDYTMTNDQGCPDDLSGPADLVVKDGEVIAAYEPDTMDTKKEYGHCFSTVPQLFYRAQARMDEAPYSTEIDYDSQYGFPTRIYTRP
ncbi:unnamed protein product, partial [Laminaria digitata]